MAVNLLLVLLCACVYNKIPFFRFRRAALFFSSLFMHLNNFYKFYHKLKLKNIKYLCESYKNKVAFFVKTTIHLKKNENQFLVEPTTDQ